MSKTFSKLTLLTSPNNSEENRIDNIFTGLWLTTLGTIILLSSLNILGPSLWINVIMIIAKWWPLLIILLGVSIIIDRSKTGKLLSNIIWYLLLLTLFVLGMVLPEVTEFDIESLHGSVIEVNRDN